MSLDATIAFTFTVSKPRLCNRNRKFTKDKAKELATNKPMSSLVIPNIEFVDSFKWQFERTITVF